MTVPERRRRDAAATRRLLLEVARRRFARTGYVGTTVRDIATEAGVNVALISRYFESKEGLFAACLDRAVDDLGRAVTDDVPLAEVAATMAHRLAGTDPGSKPDHLLLLLRSSGDAAADRIRLAAVDSMATRLAASAGGAPDEAPDEGLLLRAQVALAAALGMAMLRSSLPVEPLASADATMLQPVIDDLVTALLAS